MAYWSLALLILSVSFLAYRNPETTWKALPLWLRSKPRKALSDRSDPGPKNVEDNRQIKQNNAEQTPSLSVSEAVEEEDEEGTPKAKATEATTEVPTLSLDRAVRPENQRQDIPTEPSSSSFPAANSAQRVSSMAAPPRPAAQKPASSLMPPPAPKPSNLMPPPASKASTLMPSPSPKQSTLMPPPGRPNPLPQRGLAPSAGLRVPTTGPLPNRGPPVNSQQRAGASSNGRGKILLSPGHSPMDWAALTKSSNNLSGVPTLQRVTPSQLKTMTGRKGKPAWSSYQGKVYNITPYLPFHPGGEPELMKGAGRDSGKLFMEVHPWVNWEGMLSSCMVGILVSESEGHSTLDDMD